MVYWSIVASFDYCDFVISEFLAFSYYKMKMNYFLLTALLCACAIGLLVPVSATDNTDSAGCDTDRNCPLKMFCFNSMCAPCFNCAKIFRENRLRCSKEPSDCGKCLPGYQEDSYRRSHYHWCRPDISVAEPRITDNADDDSKFKLSSPSVAVFVVACVFVLGFVSYYCYNSNRHHDTWTTDVRANYQFSNPPPPYKEEDIPTSVADCVSSLPCSFQLEVTGLSEDNHQKAVPFLYMENSRTETGDTNGAIQFAPATPAVNSVSGTTFTAVNIDIHDETTVPSAWTPGPSYGETLTDGKNESESPPKKRKRSCQGEEKIDEK